ncbi:MAG TPA: integrase family protein [Steroidobacteraceae bacterium]|nr:integrase family protein [Steroidobacteraceae bacterium]
MRAKITNKLAERFAGDDGDGDGDGANAHQVLWDSGDGAVKGFGLRYFPGSGIKTYFIQTRVRGGKMRTIKIGRHGDPWLVDQARARARELKGQMVDGVDPVLERQRQQADREAQEARDKALGTTLQQVLDSYLADKNLRPRTADDYKAHCKRNFSEWLNEPIAKLTREMCKDKFKALSVRTKAQANLSMTYLRALCNHARKMHRTPSGQYPVLPFNPVTDMWDIADPNDTNVRDTRIPLDKIGACWNWLRDRSHTARTETDRTAADYVSLVLLTGCRRNEAGALLWTDVDLDAKTLTLRAEVTKTKRKLVLPLSTVLHEILTARKNAAPLDHKVLRRRRAIRATQYVFPSGGAKTPYMVQAPSVLEALSKIAGKYVHMHALRRTFDDMGIDCGIDGDIRRALINHVGKDVHQRNYANNPAFLAPAVEKIAQWVVNQGAIAAAGNVVQFPGRKTG